MKIDLHIHSNYSDGEHSVEKLIKKIKRKKLSVFALTDHDRADGWLEARQFASQRGLSFIPGIEITTEWRQGVKKPFGMHLLAYLPDKDNKALQEVLILNQNERERRLKKYIQNLSGQYEDLTFDLVESLSKPGSTLGRPDIARALVKLKKAKSVGKAFKGILHKNSDHYVRNEAPDVLDVIAIVRAAGGVPVLAHPSRGDQEDANFETEVFDAMVKAGLLGLEVDHIEVRGKNRDWLVNYATKHDLIMTGSSDFHGRKTKRKNPLALHTTSPEMLKRILEAGTGWEPHLEHKF
jgi:predicted metal-dependent phosphoesterase TrpH